MSENYSCKRSHLTKDQRVPRCYKDVEKIIKSVKSCQINVKTALAKSRLRGAHLKKVYKLSLNVLKYYNYIQKIVDQTQILEKVKFLRKEIATILIYELIFGNGFLPGESKAVTTIQAYQKDIFSVHEELQSNCPGILGPEIFIPRYIRVHTLVTTVAYVIKDLEAIGYKQIFYDDNIVEEKFLQLVKTLEKGHFLVDFHFKDILVFVTDENLLKTDLYKNGHIFLQDKASYIPVHVLNPEPGSTVLDACAAPGMKTAHIASKMKNKGLLIACERDKKRFETLKETLQYGSIKISKTVCTDFKLIDPYDEAYSAVEYILLDPSCSGSGMVSRMDEVTDSEDSKTKERVMKLAGFQIILLKHALKFPSVKRVVYSTCSIYEEENEYVVHEVLKVFGQSFQLVAALPEWSVRGSQHYEYGEKCIRTVPEKHLTNGFFVALFERIDGAEYQIQNFPLKKPKHRGVQRLHDINSDKVESFSNELQSKVTMQEKKNRKRKTNDEARDKLQESEKYLFEENSHKASKKRKDDLGIQQNVSSPQENFLSSKQYDNCTNSGSFQKQAKNKEINEEIHNKDEDVEHCSFILEENKSVELKKHKKKKKDKKHKNEMQNLLQEQNNDEIQIISPRESLQEYKNLETESFPSTCTAPYGDVSAYNLGKKRKHKRHHDMEIEELFEKSKNALITASFSSEHNEISGKKSERKVHEYLELQSKSTEDHCELRDNKTKHKKKKKKQKEHLTEKNFSLHHQDTECQTDILVAEPVKKLCVEEKKNSNMQIEYFENKIQNENPPEVASVKVKKHKKHKKHSTFSDFLSNLPTDDLENPSSNVIPPKMVCEQDFNDILFKQKNKKYEQSCKYDTPSEMKNVNSSLDVTVLYETIPCEAISVKSHHENDLTLNKKNKKHKNQKADSSKLDINTEVLFKDSYKIIERKLIENNETIESLNPMQSDFVEKKNHKKHKKHSK